MNKLVPFTPGLILYIALSAGCGSDGLTPNGNAGSNGQQASGAGVIPTIDTSGSLNEVVAVPESTPAVINGLFDKYTKVVAPNGKPIHIFATSGVSEAQTVRARQILSFILKDAEGTQYGSDKSAVANALGDAQATLVYFETEEQALKHRDAVSKLGLGVQDLYAEESPVEGTQAYLNNEIRDAAYEEIFHMVHGYGIETALPAFHAEMVAAQLKATARAYIGTRMARNTERMSI
ncbi:MAG: hypothetical protein KDJ38_03835 [Gammaproteobacteria bacterium]|nr:hypothetical protein [Gammaproteobacteria bacterium]